MNHLYTVNDKFAQKMNHLDSKVQNNYDGQRLYYKSNLQYTDKSGEKVYYCVPFSSYKTKQDSINNKTLFKLYGENNDPLGVLHVNNLIPVPESKLNTLANSPVKLTDKYLGLISKQNRYLDRNKQYLNEDIKLMYDIGTGNIDPKYFEENRREVLFYKKLTNNIKKLERGTSLWLERKHSKEHTANISPPKITPHFKNDIDL